MSKPIALDNLDVEAEADALLAEEYGEEHQSDTKITITPADSNHEQAGEYKLTLEDLEASEGLPPAKAVDAVSFAMR